MATELVITNTEIFAPDNPSSFPALIQNGGKPAVTAFLNFMKEDSRSGHT